jgi:ketosteroid isomerase-like protein
MLKANLLILLVVTGFSMSSCNSDKSGKDELQAGNIMPFDKQWAKSFIDSLNMKFSVEIASGDSSALAAHYWPDAELLLDNSEVVKGKDILNAWGAVIQMGVKEMIFSTTDITGSSLFIIETGNYEMKDRNKSIIDKGKYVVVWEKRNGEWKLYRDIGCTSLPLAK